MDIICINDVFPLEWELYFKNHNIIKPVRNKVYSIREVIPYLVGEKGLLLNEIVNPSTPRISPTNRLPGSAEQSWALSRFTDLNGNRLTKESISQLVEHDAKN